MSRCACQDGSKGVYVAIHLYSVQPAAISMPLCLSCLQGPSTKECSERWIGKGVLSFILFSDVQEFPKAF